MLNFLKHKKKSLSLSLSILLPILTIVTPIFNVVNFTTTPAYAASSSTDNVEKVCKNGGTGVLGWLLCPLVAGAINTFETFYEWGSQYLTIRSSLFKDITTSSGTGGLSKAWGAFRDIANVVFVVVFLVVIISQITGFGIDNYGIKRILPRLAVVAILVNISYLICQILVDVSNILGASLQGTMEQLAGEIAFPSGSADSVVGIVVGGISIGIFVGTALNFGIFFLILIFAVIGLLATLILVVFCIARDALVVVLVCLAPVAFVCYMLPNTESWFKKWTKLFEAMLLIYPTCSLMMGSGKLLCSIFSQVNAASPTFGGSLVALAALFIPFFAIPFIILNSMNALGKVGGMMKGLATKGFRSGARLGAAGLAPARKVRPISWGMNKLSGGKYKGVLSTGSDYANKRFRSAKTNFEAAKDTSLSLGERIKSGAKGVGSSIVGGATSVASGAAGATLAERTMNRQLAERNKARVARAERREDDAKWAKGETVTSIMERQAVARQNAEIREEQAKNATQDKGAVVAKLNQLIDVLQNTSSGGADYRTAESQTIAAIRDIHEKGGRKELLDFAFNNADKLTPRLINEMAGMSPEFKEFAKYKAAHPTFTDQSGNTVETTFANFVSSGNLANALMANGGSAYAQLDKDSWQFIADRTNPHPQVIQSVAAGGAGPLAVALANATDGKTITAQVSYVQNLQQADRTAVISQISAEQFTKLSNDMRGALAGVAPRGTNESETDYNTRLSAAVKTQFNAQINQINSDNRLKGRLSAFDQGLYL